MEIQINWLAIGLAVVASFVFGFLWYTPLFGKAWAKEMGFDMNEKPKPGVMIRGMVMMLIGCVLLVWVLSHNMWAWGVANAQTEETYSSAMMAATGAFFTWLGFFVPTELSGVAWERKSWKLFAINASYHFLNLLIVAMILSHVK